MNIWLKWTILVWLNAIVGLAFGLENQWTKIPYVLGVMTGICIFIPFYVAWEKYAQQNQKILLQKSLTIAIILRIFMQLLPILDIAAGLCAIEFVDNLHLGYNFSQDYTGDGDADTRINLDGDNLGFFGGLLLSLISASILSVVVAVLTVIVMIFLKIKANYWDKG